MSFSLNKSATDGDVLIFYDFFIISELTDKFGIFFYILDKIIYIFCKNFIIKYINIYKTFYYKLFRINEPTVTNRHHLSPISLSVHLCFKLIYSQ